MRPYQGGGEMIDVVTLDTVTYNEPPHRFEAGTPPIVQAIGLGAAIDYVDGLGRDDIAAHEHEIADYATEKLKRINSLRLIGDAPGKGGIFSFELKGAHAHDVSTILDRYGIAVRAGTHCAMPLLTAISASPLPAGPRSPYIRARMTSTPWSRASRRHRNSLHDR